jgi:hypothetical protein
MKAVAVIFCLLVAAAVAFAAVLLLTDRGPGSPLDTETSPAEGPAGPAPPSGDGPAPGGQTKPSADPGPVNPTPAPHRNPPPVRIEGVHHPLIGILPEGARASAFEGEAPPSDEQAMEEIRKRYETGRKERQRQEEMARKELALIRQWSGDEGLPEDQALAAYEVYLDYYNTRIAHLRKAKAEGDQRADEEILGEYREAFRKRIEEALTDPGAAARFLKAWDEAEDKAAARRESDERNK